MASAPTPLSPIAASGATAADTVQRWRLLAALAPPAVALLCLTVLHLVPGPPAGAQAPAAAGVGLVSALGLALVLAAGTLHRPLEGTTLSLGAVALPWLLVGASPALVGWTVFGGYALGELGRRVLWRLSPVTPPERRRLLRTLEGAGRATLAALAAAGALSLVARALGGAPGRLSWTAQLAALGTYLIVLAALILVDQRLHERWRRVSPGGRPFRPSLDRIQPLALDLGAWIYGVAVALVGLAGRPGLGAVLLAGFAALAFEAARSAFLRGAFERRVSELEQVGRAGWRMQTSGFGFDALAARIRIECSRVVPFQWFQLEVVMGEGPAAAAAGDGPAAGVETRSWWAGPTGRIQEGVPDPGDSPPALLGIHRRPRWRLLERELEAEGERLASLTLWCDPRRLGPGDVALLDTLLPQLSAWVHRAKLDREAREDPLTGVLVRRGLERAMGEAFRRRYEGGGSLALVMCDVDHFKRINDTWGHAAGDRVLVAVARTLEERAGQAFAGDGREAVCGRYGGEEFVLVLDGATGAEGLAVAEGLRRALAALELTSEEGEAIPITASFGIAAFPELYTARADELLGLADQALYEAKESGRNRCLLHLGQARGGASGGPDPKAGRFESPDGTISGPDPEGERSVEAPRIFA